MSVSPTLAPARPGKPAVIKVLLADDHEMIRAGLKALIGANGDMEVVSEAATGREAVERARDRAPDVVVMDLRMPDLNGIDATRQILHESARVRVVALSAHADQRMAAEALRAGAAAYVLKESAFEELLKAIRTVVDGGVYLSPRVAGAVVDGFVRGGPAGAPASAPSVFAALTAREREVLQLMAEGRTTKGIAHALSVSIKTVETHRRNLMEKLKIDSVAELTKYAIREGLTSLET